jgi:O-antigen ligase
LVFGTLALAPLLFHVGTPGVFEFPKVQLLIGVAVLLSALGLTWLLGRGRWDGAALAGWWREDLLATGWVLFLLSAVISTVTSLSPLTSLRGRADNPAGLLTLLSYAVLFFAVRLLCRHGADARRCLAALVLAGVLAAGYALVQYAGLDPVTWTGVSQVGDYFRPFGTVGHANMLAAFVVAVLPLAVYFAGRAWRQRRWAALAVVAGGGVAMVAAVGVALSRAAYLGLAAVVLVLVTALVLSARRLAPAAAVALAVLVLPLAVLVLNRHHPQLAPVWERLGAASQDEARQEIWRAALALFWEKPRCGQGLDTFGLAFASHRTARFALLEWYHTPTHAHNELLQVLATQGLPGLLAVLVMLAGLGQSAWRACRRPDGLDRGLVAALMAALTGVLVPTLFGFTLVPAGVAFVTVAALLSRCRNLDEQAPVTGQASPAAFAGLGVAGAVALALFLWNWWSHPVPGAAGWLRAWVGLAMAGGVSVWALASLVHQRNCQASLPRANESGPVVAFKPTTTVRLAQVAVWLAAGWILWQAVVIPWQANRCGGEGERLLAANPTAGLEALRRATALDGSQDAHWARLGDALFQAAGHRDVSPEQQQGRLLEAKAAFEQACRLVPRNAYHHYNRGRVLAQLAGAGRCAPAEAFEAFETALALDPHNIAFHGDATHMALAARDWDRAAAYAGRWHRNVPGFGPPVAHLGFVALQRGRPAEADALLRESFTLQWIGFEEELAVAFANLAAARLELNDPEGAVRYAREALGRSSWLAEVRPLLARAEQALQHQ